MCTCLAWAASRVAAAAERSSLMPPLAGRECAEFAACAGCPCAQMHGPRYPNAMVARLGRVAQAAHAAHAVHAAELGVRAPLGLWPPRHRVPSARERRASVAAPLLCTTSWAGGRACHRSRGCRRGVRRAHSARALGGCVALAASLRLSHVLRGGWKRKSVSPRCRTWCGVRCVQCAECDARLAAHRNALVDMVWPI